MHKCRNYATICRFVLLIIGMAVISHHELIFHISFILDTILNVASRAKIQVITTQSEKQQLNRRMCKVMQLTNTTNS